MHPARPRISSLDATAIVVGVIVGAGIFRAPPVVAANAGGERIFLGLWVAGGLISLAGALCYAELSATYPDEGGDYHFLRRAFGPVTSTLFAWARLTVIQSGSIAMLAFVVGDYAGELVRLGPHSTSAHAALATALLTAVNAAGLRPASRVQQLITGALLVGLVITVALGATLSPAAGAPAQASSSSLSGLSTAMIFVLLTYSGWNEGAYLSAEVRDPGRRMPLILIASIGLVTLLYLAVNLVALRGLGLAGLASSQALAADLLRRVGGTPAAAMVSALVVLAALSTMNGSIITGARTGYALGRDLPSLRFLRAREARTGSPLRATLMQGALALLLVGVGAASKSGFVAMVDFTAPVFWFFFLLSGVSLLVLRRRHPDRPRPFRVPLYPATPLLFVAACLFMLQASLLHTGRGALVGVGVLLAGVPLAWLAMKSRRDPDAFGGERPEEGYQEA